MRIGRAVARFRGVAAATAVKRMEYREEGMEQTPQVRHCILLVDDEVSNLQILREALQSDYRLLVAKDGLTATKLAESMQPDLILMDVMMPTMDGYEACRIIKANTTTRRIPVIFVSARNDVGDESEGFAAGAVDYISKPISPSIVRARVRTHLSLVQVEELQRTRLEIVHRLGRAAEYRDNETGLHVIRMSHFSHRLALAAGWPEQRADELLHAAPMHDIGKIGIPDRVLLKPAPFDDGDWKIMRRHPWIGAQIIGEHDSSLLRLAREVAFAHHERWDGSGYPRALVGADIPESARIVAIADVYDALTNERPYKPAWTNEAALDYLRANAHKRFERRLVDLFLQCTEDVFAIQRRWSEPDRSPG